MDYFLYTGLGGIGIGCGEKFGIYIDKELYKGSSSWCSVFSNE